MPAVNGLLGRKLGMTSVFDEAGRRVPVTVIEAGPCSVVQVRTQEVDGYSAVQLGFGEYPPPPRRPEGAGALAPRGRSGNRARSKPNRPTVGHFEKAGVRPSKHLAEFSVEHEEELRAGQEVRVSIFRAGQKVKIRGVSKGRGFTGVVRRWGFSGHPASHGAKIHRTPASAGATDPARVFKGKKSPGHMGACNATVRNLVVIRVDEDRNLLLVRGGVPGAPGGLLRIEGSQATR